MEQYLKEYMILSICILIGLIYATIVYYIEKYILKIDRKNIDGINTWYD